MFQRMLVAVDFSDNSEYVVDQSARLAARLGSEMRLIHVEVLQVGELDYDLGTAEDRARIASEPGGELHNLQRLCAVALDHGIVADYVSESGRPAERILAAAEDYEAELIVLGSHGHGKLYHMLAGSVRESMVVKSYLPILVIRKPLG